MGNTQNEQKVKIILMVGIIMFILSMGAFFAGFYLTEEKIIYEDKIIYQEKEQPMILVEFIEWGGNINDNAEAIFNFFIYNFGDIEAKNVKVRCEVSDINDNLLREQVFNIGNIASNSYEYQESYMKYSSNAMKELGMCYLESVDGDYINLYERLNDLE